VQDEFDLRYGVETSTRVHLTDLKIDSPNWIYAGGYCPLPLRSFMKRFPRCRFVMRILYLSILGPERAGFCWQASDLPFRRIIGVEFSPELHNIAVSNIGRYKSDRQQCREIESVCMDFIQFEIPQEPLVAFLYNPSSETITAALANNIAQSLMENPRELWVIYVTLLTMFLKAAGRWICEN